MKSGIVTILGRPNVGKSTLLNALVKRKVSIVSHKPQTTRHRIQGVLHESRGQVVFVDTPGLHRKEERALNRVMNASAVNAAQDVDLILFVVESLRFNDDDQRAFEAIKDSNIPVALIVNKVDQIEDKDRLLPELEKLGNMHDFVFILPISAAKNINTKVLINELFARLPEGDPLYPDDMHVGHGLAFSAAEAIREKLIRNLHQELPYALTVEIEKYEQEEGLDRISAVIWVERDGQKKIVIGKDGETLKLIGSNARRDIERAIKRKVFLRLWCKVRENWSDDPRSLTQFGYSSE